MPAIVEVFSRGERIRTSEPSVPNEVISPECNADDEADDFQLTTSVDVGTMTTWNEVSSALVN